MNMKPSEISDELDGLKIPVFLTTSKTSGGTKPSGKDGDWHMQNYANFAEKVKKMNPDVIFSKSLTDKAFDKAALKMKSTTKMRAKYGNNWRSFDAMMARVSIDQHGRVVCVMLT